MNVTAEEWQVLSFFEVQPELSDPDEPWCYNDAVYVIERDGHRLSFALAPAYRDVRIILTYKNTRLYEFNSMSVQDVRYKDERGDETLEVIVSDRERVLLRVKPHIEILHKLDDDVA